MAWMAFVSRWRRSGVLVLLVLGCGRTVYQPTVQPASTLTAGAPTRLPLKVHTFSGDLHVLSEVREEGDSVLIGRGRSYGPLRLEVDQEPRDLRIPIDSVALVETETPEVIRPAGLTLLPIFVTLTAITTGVCLADPKSCFGSCPTFYTATDPNRPVAEGFSGSIARSLEARDLDALPTAAAPGGRLRLLMRNEALETHAIRSVALVAVSRPSGSRVVVSPAGEFFPAADLVPPSGCRGADGDCLEAVAARDGAERWRPTDATDLAAPDQIVLEFPRPTTAGDLGVLLVARQSFVSTYLLYQTMAHAGSRAGDLLAGLERRGEAAVGSSFDAVRILGDISVDLEQDGRWVAVGRFGEPGPLATDTQVLPLGVETTGTMDSIRIRLTMAQGAWRLDQVNLVTLGARQESTRLLPVRVDRSGRPEPTALKRLVDPDQYLVTYPGDSYWIEWQLPAGLKEAEFFLESTGYYYEWMRPGWIAEESPERLARLATDPRGALRDLAPGFKTLEPGFEQRFWASRFRQRR